MSNSINSTKEGGSGSEEEFSNITINKLDDTNLDSNTNIVSVSEVETKKLQENMASLQIKENLAEMKLDQVLKINTYFVNYGDVFPGQILEETIIIANKLKTEKIPFRIKINCLVKIFDNLDEYVYSMRRPSQTETFNYNDVFLIMLSPDSISYYKLALKVPNYFEEMEILGTIEITSNEFPDEQIIIPIKSQITLPKIKCEKMIFIKSLNISVVKLFLKNLKRQDFRITFKSFYGSNLSIEPSVIKSNKLPSGIDFSFFPNLISVAPNIQTHFVFSVKTNLKAEEEENSIKELNCIIIAKIKNSNIYYAFPVVILIGDGKNMEMSS